ncbi:cell division protein FtsQ [Flavobacteriaceae bacterium MAR_2010_188]|nr:cell division protein FtsQ [Flavobacteriaceae bacterium MAR_2010_188]
MKINYNYLKIIALCLVVAGLYAFSTVRNVTRMASVPDIVFTGDDNLFITEENVSKLLIQNQDGTLIKPKEIIDLNELESALNSSPMIKNAQVYMSVDGKITAEIEQKKPIARVSTNASYYIDDEGSYMPLSDNYSARVPLVTGFVYKNDLTNLYKISKRVQEDEFLLKHVVQIQQNEDQTIDLRFRLHDFIIRLGSLDFLDKKINNLKAFYQKTLKDSTLDNYSALNLKFDNQVIATKK